LARKGISGFVGFEAKSPSARLWQEFPAMKMA
jgi:hypothetical protein